MRLHNENIFDPTRNSTYVASEYDILQTMWMVNERIAEEGSCTLNYMHSLLGLMGSDRGEIYGWDKWVNYRLLYKYNEKTKQYYREIAFSHEPKIIRTICKV